MRLLKWIVSVFAVLALAACGGGGSDAGDPPFGDGSGTGGDTPTYTVSVVLSDQVVTASQPSTVTAVVTNSDGDPQANVVVTFATSLSLGQFTATTALTGEDGKATTTLSPASSSSVGADTVIATATIGGAGYTGSVGFQLTASDVTIASFTADVGSQKLGAYAETQLSVVLDGTNSATPVTLNVSSACVTQGRATLTPASISTSTGSATFTYRDAGCGAFNNTDTLTVSITGSGATGNVTLGLTAPSVASIAFVSASPSQIYLKGSGFDESSIVSFQVRDANGVGVPNKKVTLAPSTLAGGLLIEGASSAVERVSDADGKVLVRINSGTVPTPVRVTATLVDDATVSTVSSNLAIAVGLPSQRNFSLSQATLNVEGFDRDGTTNTYTIIASDRLGNPVPAGTTINFVTEGGQVQAVGTTTVTDGLASVTVNFQTSSPRPDDGRVTVLAYALGEEAFLDQNGNNVYDSGEDYQDLGDVFLDRLFNGSYNQSKDQFISLELGGTSACHDATSDLLQLGVNEPSRALDIDGKAIKTCASGWGRAYVRKAAQTIFSTSGARLGYRASPDPRAYVSSGNTCPIVSLIDIVATSPYDALADAETKVDFYELGTGVALYGMGKTGSFSFLVADENPKALNPMAAGTTLSVASTPGLSATVIGSRVPNTLNPSASAVAFEFDDKTTSGTVTITVSSPAGLASIFAVPITQSAAPNSAVRCLQ